MQLPKKTRNRSYTENHFSENRKFLRDVQSCIVIFLWKSSEYCILGNRKFTETPKNFRKGQIFGLGLGGAEKQEI
jgi:hypothetical protein